MVIIISVSIYLEVSAKNVVCVTENADSVDLFNFSVGCQPNIAYLNLILEMRFRNVKQEF